MVNEVTYTSINRVLDNLLDHPMLKNVTLEQAVRHALRFISLHGYPALYQDKVDDVDIHEFRGILPCGLIRITQVKDLATGICLRAMTDNFPSGMLPRHEHPMPHHHGKPWYIPPSMKHCEELSFKTQGNIIYTSFPEGKVGISYKAIPVDEEGFPLLIDNEVYLAALEAYIKQKVFTVKFDEGKISAQVLQNANRDYALLAKELQSEFTIPSLSEMEAISRELTHLIPRTTQFDDGFKHLGDREYLRRH